MKVITQLWVAACVVLLCASGCAKTEDQDDGMTDTMVGTTGGTNPATGSTGMMGSGTTDPMPGSTGDGTEPPPSGASGSSAPPVMGGEDPAPMEPPPTGNLPKTIPSARGMCNIMTDFAGDDACLAPPDPEKGFQIHIGPTDYNDMAQVNSFVMQPGDESSRCYLKKLPIDMDILYLQYELSGRPGTHHIINTLLTTDKPEGWGTCESFAPGSGNGGSIGGASKAWMPPIPVAPENENLGIPLAAHMQVQHDMHYFNLTDKPILREFWMNVYYVDPAKVTERPNRIGGLGGFGWNYAPIQPGTHQTYPYECPINADGRIIQLLGHTHAHGIRETAHIRRASGERIKVFEQYDYLEPQIFMYDSLTENPEFSTTSPGAYTGLLEVSAGDVLEWECEVNNDSTTPLRYTNQVQTGEMCNIWGMSVGPMISCFLQ